MMKYKNGIMKNEPHKNDDVQDDDMQQPEIAELSIIDDVESNEYHDDSTSL